MNLALILLKQSNVHLICLTEQLDYEPAVHMRLPHAIGGKTKLTLTRWPEHTPDEHVLLHSDSLLTICEPSEELKEAFMKKTGLTEEDLMPKPVRTILQEEEQAPQFEDEYEPEYVEET